MTDTPASDPPRAPSGALVRDHEGRPTYRHRPKLIGAEISFTLEDRDLVWSDGRASGRLPLHQIESVRIAFRPANLYMHRYRVDIRQRLGQKVWFSNVSWRGMAEMEANDPAFSAFVRVVLAAIAKASPKARFIAGEPAWRYAIVAMITGLLAFCLAYLTVQGVRGLNWGLLGLVVFIGGYTVWQMGLWLTKNRPATFDPLEPPAELLPATVSRRAG